MCRDAAERKEENKSECETGGKRLSQALLVYKGGEERDLNNDDCGMRKDASLTLGEPFQTRSL